MKLIIDLDSCVYAAAGAAQQKELDTQEIIAAPVEHALANAKSKIQKILDRFEVKKEDKDRYVSYLTAAKDLDCFRTKLYPEYKANRKKYSKPVHYQAVRDYYVKQWNAEIVSGIEADDRVCMEQYKYYSSSFAAFTKYNKYPLGDYLYSVLGNFPSMICGIDKDLDQIPGLHYNYQKDSMYYITPLQGCKNFYKQMLAGDTSDNIPRVVYRWKKKEAFKKIDEAKSEEEIKEIVWDEVNKHLKYERIATSDSDVNTLALHRDRVDVWLNRQGNLLHLRRFEGDKYEW